MGDLKKILSGQDSSSANMQPAAGDSLSEEETLAALKDYIKEFYRQQKKKKTAEKKRG